MRRIFWLENVKGRSRRRWDYNIRVVARDIGWEGLDWIHLA